MKRRELLYVTGATGILAVAGCISDEGDDGTDDEGAGPAADSNDGNGDGSGSGDDSENGDDGEEGDSDALETARAFLEAWSEAEIDRVNELIHEDSEMEELDEDAREELEEISFTITDLELTDEQSESDESVVVAFLLEVEPEGDEGEPQTVSQELELRMEGDVWRVWRMRPGGEERLPGPAVQLGTDYDDGGLTIRHEGGDHILATNLFLRGEGLSETGSWLELDGETSSEVGDEPAIAAGDQVTVDVDDEYTLRIVWDDGEDSRVLHSVSGAREIAADIDAPPVVLEYLEDTDNFTGVADATDGESVTVRNGEVDTVDSQPFAFEPAAIRITPGTEVTWEWVGDAAHSVTHEGDAFESDVLDGEDATFSHTFEEPGIYLYYCAPHRALGHRGAVIVEESDAEGE